MEFFMTPVTSVQELVRDNKIDALVVTSRKRMSALPNVPTAEEMGYKDSDFDFWVGLLVPKQTPRAIVDAMHAQALKVMQSAAYREQMSKIGGEIMDPMSPAEFDKFVAGEIARNRTIAQAAGIEAK
jgi:tripartite-type tricarboxylate transporter receptor subunit TctC